MKTSNFLFRSFGCAALAAALVGCGAPAPESEPPELPKTAIVPETVIAPEIPDAPTITPEVLSPPKRPKPLTPAGQAIAAPPPVLTFDPMAGFKAACTQRIKSKMLDPNAASIVFTPLPGEDGFVADVSLVIASTGRTMTFQHSCRRDANGDVFTKQIRN